MSEKDAPASNGAPPLSTYGVKDSDAVTVFDPKTNGLKLATGAQAKALAAQGYKIGVEAEYEAKKTDGLARVSTGLNHAANMLSFGTFDGVKALAGRGDQLRTERELTEANPDAALTGDVLGIGGQIYTTGAVGAGKAIGGLGSRLLAGTRIAKLGQSAAEAGTMTNLARAAINAGTAGAGGAFVQGSMDEAVNETILKDPLSIEKIAMGGITDVLWNAAFGVGLHGIISAPKVLRSGGAGIINGLENIGAIGREKIKVQPKPGSGPILTGFSIRERRGQDVVEKSEQYKRAFDKTEAEISNQTKNVDAELRETGTYSDDLDELTKKTTVKSTEKVPIANREIIEPGAASAEAQAALNKDAPLDKEAAAEQRWGFDWHQADTDEEKIATLRKAMHWHVDKKPESLALWDELFGNEKRIEELQAEIKDGKNIAKNHSEINRLIQEKEAAKEILSEEHPRIVHDDGQLTPGFRDLNDEYARVKGKIPASDVTPPKFGVKVPEPKGAKAKPVKEKAPKQNTAKVESVNGEEAFSQQFSEESSHNLNASIKEETGQTYQGAEQWKDSVKKKTTTKTTLGTTDFTHRYKMPKAEPVYVDGKYIPKFDAKTIGLTGLAASKMGPLGWIPGAGAAAMTGANTAAHLANHGRVIGDFVEKYGGRLAKVGGVAVVTAGRAARQLSKQSVKPEPFKPGDYQAAANVINYAKTNPQAIHAHLEKAYPYVAENHPEVLASVYATMMRGVDALDQAAPKRPYNPTLQEQDFIPPRAQQVKFMRRWRTLANTDEALDGADPETMEMLRTVFPAWHDSSSKELAYKVSTMKKKLTGRAARQVSAFLGSGVRPTDDAKALKRLQETSGPAPKPQAGQPQDGNPKSTGGAKSAKITQAAVSADATSIQQREMGL